jgi:hypothetical protein
VTAVQPDPSGTASERGLSWRGVVEGFYGDPWSFEERAAFFEFAARVGLTSYIYAPKFDPFHRERWREPYPAAELAVLAQLNHLAAVNGVEFVYAISPALSMGFSLDDDHRALEAKCEQLWEAGIRSFSLLFDDVPTELPHESDRERFGAGANGSGLAHGHAVRLFQEGFLARHGLRGPLLVCPTDYAGTATSPYREGFAVELPADARILWTGPDIVVRGISREDIDRAAESYGRDLVLWDNFPVNDFDRSRLFLGPLTGRTGDVAGSRLVGIAANPMVEAAPSRFALATVAEWAADPAGYDPHAAAERSFASTTSGVDGLRALVDACSSWPPSDPPSAAIDALLPDSLSGDRIAIAALSDRMRALAATSALGAPPDLAAGLEPWLCAARAAGVAGELACRVLAGELGLGSELTAASARSQAHYPNVLRGPVTALVDAALASMGSSAGEETADRVDRDAAPGGNQPRTRRILLLSGANPSPGDRELAEFLGAAGFEVTIRAAFVPGEFAEASLLIVTPASSEADAVSLAHAAVPVIAWGHLVAIGLATESATLLSLDAIDIVAPSHPCAAGLTGRASIYRGPSRVTWGEPGEDALVVAREPETEHPVVALYPIGSRLPDGSIAPAVRATLFMGPDGFAPWLVTQATRSLVLALVRNLS